MSGFEIVGVVLGAFPLVVLAIDGYRKALESIGMFKHAEELLKTFERRINRMHFVFRENVQQLLKPLENSEEIKMLLDNPDDPNWKTPKLDEGVRKQLSGSYQIYIETIEDYHAVMEDLVSLLGKSKANVRDNSRSSKRPDNAQSLVGMMWHNSERRLNIAMTRKRRDVCIRELFELNQSLSDFVQHEERNEGRLRSSPAHKSRLGLSGPTLQRFWKHADQLHRVVQRAWCCPCREYHTADMILQHPQKFDEVCFKMLFKLESQTESSQMLPWKVKEMDIAVHEKASLKGKQNPRSPIQITNESSQGALRFASDKHKRRSSRGLSLMMQTANLLALPPMQPEEIKDLCRAIATRGRSGSFLGALTDDEQYFSVYHKTSKIQKDLDRTVLRELTLEELLRNPPPGLKLLKRQRWKIALSIASAYLQLHASPWIQNGWRRQEIYFWYDDRKGLFHEQPQIPGKCIRDNAPNARNSDESIWTLGITLLGVCSGWALEDEPGCQRYSPPDGQPNMIFDRAAATEWCRNTEGELGTPFADAIHWCLGHSASKRHMEINDKEWRQGLFAHVVQPMAESYEMLFAKMDS